MQAMLHDKVRAESAERLKSAWAKAGDTDASPADEHLIAEAIRKVRAERKAA